MQNLANKLWRARTCSPNSPNFHAVKPVWFMVMCKDQAVRIIHYICIYCNVEYMEMISMLFPTDPAEIVLPVADVIGNETFSASLTCVVQGIPIPVVAWTAEDSSSNLNNDSTNNTFKYSIKETVMVFEGLSRIKSVLTIANLSLGDESTYRCAGSNNVTNLLGVVADSDAILTVQGRSLHILTMPSLICLSLLMQFLLVYL